MMPTSSETGLSTSTTNIPTKTEAAALFVLINRARQLNGWKAKSSEDLEPIMLMWYETFRRYNVPLDAYKEIFDMAFDIRMTDMGKGDVKNAPVVDAALLVSCYTRPHGVKAQIEQRMIEAGRTLAGTAKSTCLRCEGSGFEYKYDVDGRRLGILSNNCDHRPIAEGEPMFKPRTAGNVVPINQEENR